MGIARFGHRPKVADVFCGSGQIPFEAARLGCDVYASDLNPIACMLTWGSFNIVGASTEKRIEINSAQKELAKKVQDEIEDLRVETDGKGWRAKAFLYCVEIICPESGWEIPLLPSLIISKGYKVIAQLVPVPSEKRYNIEIIYVDNDEAVEVAKVGTIQKGDIVHSPDGINTYRVNINTIRGDYKDGKDNRNRLRLWEKSDFVPRPDDIFQERLYCVQWMKKKHDDSKKINYEFRTVTNEDLNREQRVINFVNSHFSEWQEKGFIPDMVIERGYNTDQPIRERGWTHWHHLFNSRQLLVASFIRKNLLASDSLSFGSYLNYNSKLCRWDSNPGVGRVGKVQGVFDNQALNTLYNYGCRSFQWSSEFFNNSCKHYPILASTSENSHSAKDIETENDIYITDPPYGDAVKYEEITEFFIAWLRNPPPR